MSTRSPTPDGLAVSPNAAGFGANPPANGGEMQFQCYWGRYLDTTFLPNVGLVNGLPVVSANPAGLPAFDKLLPGDVAFVEGAAPPSISNLYVCIDRGTLSGNDAQWMTLGDPAGPTIRDAHVIVVGQGTDTGPLSTAPFLSAVTPPGVNAPSNGLNLGGVGEVEGITCDFSDAGDCAELNRALLAAAAGGVPIDIRLRPCRLDMDPTLAPLTIPDFTRLIGGGSRISYITGGVGTGGTSQGMFILLQQASIEDMNVSSPAPTDVPAGPEEGVIQLSGSGQVLRCTVSLFGNSENARVNTVAAIRIAAPSTATTLVDDCELLVDSLFIQTPALGSYGVWVGNFAGSGQRSPFDVEVRNTKIFPASKNAGSAPLGVGFFNIEGGRCFNVQHLNAQLAQSFIWAWTTPPFSLGAFPPIRGVSFIECRATTFAEPGGQAVDLGPQTGFNITVDGTAEAPGGWSDFKIHDCEVVFNGSPGAFVRTGFLLRNAVPVGQVEANTTLANVTYDNCKAYAARIGFDIQSEAGEGQPGDIYSVKFTACQARNEVGGSGFAHGLRVTGSANQLPNVFNVGVVNCDFSGVPDTANNSGVLIANLNVVDTLIGFNNLTPATPAAFALGLVDNGTNTNAANNIT
jgi:hypothetical protein